jgi:hypothetical protein
MAVDRRKVIIGVVVLGGGVVGYEIYKYEKQKSAAASAATTSAAVAATGYGYGSPYGYGSSGYGYGYQGVTYGYGASGGFPAGYYGYGVPAPPGGTPPPVAATTNAQWDQAAITQLQNDGYDPATISGALGAYLNGQPVSSSQVNIVDAAIGIEGYPPVAGSSGYPPAIKTGGTPGGGSGGGQGSKVVVPNVKGKAGEQARDEITRVGLKDAQVPSSTPKGKATVVTSQSPAAGKSVNSGSTVTVHVKVK